mmetsp:Transcript_1356/g.2717  ORF Transcript_1356/g.2717 Transcript_1356/m.2717 type:complete len:1002 (+) Transcript_1356:165-3170(+)
MSTSWNPNNHGFTSGPSCDPTMVTPGSVPASLINSNISSTIDKGDSPSSTSSEATGKSKGGSTKEEMGQGQGQFKRGPPMVPIQQQLHDQQPAGVGQRPPSSASTSSATSFHTGASSGVPRPPHHLQHHLHHSSVGMGGNNNHPMAPQYRHAPSHHHTPHGQPNHFYHGEQIMGAIRGQGRPHEQDHQVQNNNYHQHGLNRPTGRYPVQHSTRTGEGYGHHAHGHGHFGRPGQARNYHQHQQHQHQPQYHSFPLGPHVKPGSVPQGMGQQGGSRGPSPTHLQQQYSTQRQKSVSPAPPGVAVAIAQSQPLRRLSQNGGANNTTDVNSGPNAAHEDAKHPSNNRGPDGSYQSKQEPTQQNHHQQQTGSGHTASLRPQSRQEIVDMSLQEQYRHHAGPSDMHQGYSSHQYQNQYPQHDRIHYGGQPSMHHGGHPNNMHPETQHHNYHHPPHGAPAPGPPIAHNHYRGYPDNAMPTGYPHGAGGHREMYPHANNQHYHHQHQQPHSYGQPPPPPSGLQRGPGHGFQLPKYNANQAPGDPTTSGNKNELRQSINRSPSPPPSPPPAPSAQALLRAKLREQGVKKVTDQILSPATGEMSMNTTQESTDNTSENPSRRNSNGSYTSIIANKPMALGDRGNVVVTAPVSGLGSFTKKPATETVSKTAKQEDITADAASILLQLGSVLNRSTGGSENQNPCSHPSPPIPSSVQHSSSMDDVSDAGTMLTMQTEVPDLTSGPSSDSIDTEMSGASASRLNDTPIKSNTTTKQDPDTDFPCVVPDRYPTRLALPYDNAKLNNLHCYLRSELLEIFVVGKSNKKSPCHSPSSSVGRVGLRCVHCSMSRMSCADAPMSVFYPKSIAEIYRLVTSWQRCHLRKCKKIPPTARAKWQELRDNDKSRGKTHYWVTSAKSLGLMDCQSRAGGIRFKPNFDPSILPPDTLLTPSAKEAAEAAERAAAIAAKAQKIVSMATAVASSNMAAVSISVPVPESTDMTDAPAPAVVASAAIRT